MHTESVELGSPASAGAIPDYPMARTAHCPFDPPPRLREVQSETAISKVRLWDGSTPWLVTRYADQRALLADPRISADITLAGYPHPSAGLAVRTGQTRSFVGMDDPEHARLRRMVTALFTVKRAETLRPAIQRIVDGLIDGMLSGPKPVDLVEAFALPVPSQVICELLGVPYADHDFFQENSRIIVSRDQAPERSAAAQSELIGYLDRLVAAKLANPAQDLLSKLAVEQVAIGNLSQREAAAMGMLLLVAGHETTANMIALGTLALLEHPGQLAALRDGDDPVLIAGAVEELLRYLTILQSGRRRVALADIDLHGQVIHAGDGVIFPSDAGNRDEEVFTDPDRLDVHRDARGHLAFGFGVHQCLGQALARVELQVAYGTLFRRVPGLRLAVGLDQVPFKHDGLVYGVYELPVTW
ncbi:cytochrome P450 [Planotetraspora sp. GP83]|uniref:cytochrome P450 n=1 Tax=Planotetraspora sp. GP83 TaxID=3156264 RepID=UPI0035138C8F